MDSTRRQRALRLLIGDRAEVTGPQAPTSTIQRVWRGHPEIVFLLCLAVLYEVNYTSIATHGWVPWTFQELTFQRVPDPVVPFTIGATVVCAVVLAAVLTPQIGLPRAVLVGISVPVAAVGAFELAYLFMIDPAAFWIPSNPDPLYWGYVAALLSYVVFGFVGVGWWRVPRWWWYVLIGVAAGFAIWYAAGVPLTLPSIGGRTTPPGLLLPVLVGNVILKWAVFILFAAPIMEGVRRGASRNADSDASPPSDINSRNPSVDNRSTYSQL